MPKSRLTELVVLAFVSLAANVAVAAVPIPKPPAIDARAYVLVDYQSGRVLADYKADVQSEPASITKVMTGYGVFRAIREKRLSITDSVTISEHAWKAEGSRTFAQVGTQIPVDTLIGSNVQSGNDATIACIPITKPKVPGLSRWTSCATFMMATLRAGSGAWDGLARPEPSLADEAAIRDDSGRPCSTTAHTSGPAIESLPSPGSARTT